MLSVTEQSRFVSHAYNKQLPLSEMSVKIDEQSRWPRYGRFADQMNACHPTGSGVANVANGEKQILGK